MQFPPIVMLTTGVFPVIGGLEIAVLNFARILADHGHDVHVIAPMQEGLAERENIDSVCIHRFLFDWDEALGALLHNMGTDEFRSKTIRNIQSILNEIGQLIIVHAHGEAIIVGGWLKDEIKNIKLVYSPHSSPEGLKELFQTQNVGDLYFRPAIKKADIIAYHSVNLIPGLKELGVDPSKIREIINFINPILFDPSRFDQISARRALNLPETAKILFSPSRVDEEKGLVELVSALPMILEQYPNSYLYIAGDLEYGFMFDPSAVQHKIERRVRKILPEGTDRVCFTGAIPYHSMPKWYSAADMIVLISRDECMPMCLLEAMAMEKPIVATNVGGIPALLKDNTKRLIEVRNDGKASPDAVASAIIEEFAQKKNNVALLRRLREKILTEYSPEAGYQKLKAIYSELSTEI